MAQPPRLGSQLILSKLEIICYFQEFMAKVCRTNSSKATITHPLGPFFDKPIY